MLKRSIDQQYLNNQSGPWVSKEPQVPQEFGIKITSRMVMWWGTTKLQINELEFDLQCRLSQQSEISFKIDSNI